MEAKVLPKTKKGSWSVALVVKGSRIQLNLCRFHGDRLSSSIFFHSAVFGVNRQVWEHVNWNCPANICKKHQYQNKLISWFKNTRHPACRLALASHEYYRFFLVFFHRPVAASGSAGDSLSYSWRKPAGDSCAGLLPLAEIVIHILAFKWWAVRVVMSGEDVTGGKK